MKRKFVPFVFLTVVLASCASLNPYVRESKYILTYFRAKFCWVPIGAESEASSCQNQAAAPRLAECVEELRLTAGFFTGEERARQDLSLCMVRKGWRLLHIEGVILG